MQRHFTAMPNNTTTTFTGFFEAPVFRWRIGLASGGTQKELCAPLVAERERSASRGQHQPTLGPALATEPGPWEAHRHWDIRWQLSPEPEIHRQTSRWSGPAMWEHDEP